MSDEQGTDQVIDEPEVPHAHHKSGIAWLDLSLAVAVLVLSGASLLTAQHTGHTMEKLVEENSRLVRANATPVLQFLTGNVAGENERAISLSVANVGTGTARVIWFEVARNGVPQTDPNDLIDYAPKAEEQDYLPTRPVGGTYFPAGETRQFVTWSYPKGAISQAKWTAFDSARSDLKVTACYCSVLGECWTSHLGADVPRPVAQCTANGHVNFRESPGPVTR